jgi:hypothetical protein
MDSRIDFLLEEIRKACELGNVNEVILLSKKLSKLNNANTITITRDKYGNAVKVITDENGDEIIEESNRMVLQRFIEEVKSNNIYLKDKPAN